MSFLLSYDVQKSVYTECYYAKLKFSATFSDIKSDEFLFLILVDQ